MNITPKEFADALGLSVICATGRENERRIGVADLCRPGLQFSGYFDVFAFERPQLIGKTEMAYLNSLAPDVLVSRLDRYFSYDIPCIIIARGMECPPQLLFHARQNGVPVYGTHEETSAFAAMAMAYLGEAFAPRQTCHGVLMDIYGVGVMITGESGVGKSECALELVRHGHQLVADDVVDIFRVGNVLWGEAPEMVRDFMELRGVGIVDIKEIFGIGAIVRRMRVDLVIHMDPVVTDDEQTNLLKAQVNNIVKSISKELSIHDFRAVTGPTHTNLVFDIVIPPAFSLTDSQIKQTIYARVKELGNYYCVITVDHNYAYIPESER